MPTRIQRRRDPGWRAPLDAQGRRPVYVGRPTRWGNPWAITKADSGLGWVVTWDWRGGWDIGRLETATRVEAQRSAVGLYREWLDTNPDLAQSARAGLADRDLMCWCPPELSCHADALLEICNPTKE